MTRAARRHPAAAAAADLRAAAIRFGPTTAAQDAAILTITEWLDAQAAADAVRKAGEASRARAASRKPGDRPMVEKVTRTPPANRASGGGMAGPAEPAKDLRTGRAKEGKRAKAGEPKVTRPNKPAAAATSPAITKARAREAAATAAVAAAHDAGDWDAHHAATKEYIASHAELGAALQAAGKPATAKADLAN